MPRRRISLVLPVPVRLVPAADRHENNLRRRHLDLTRRGIVDLVHKLSVHLDRLLRVLFPLILLGIDRPAETKGVSQAESSKWGGDRGYQAGFLPLQHVCLGETLHTPFRS